VEDCPTVFIGEKHHDAEEETRAELKLAEFFPSVAFVTTPEGARLIPIGEVYKMEEALRKESEEARREGRAEGYEKGRTEGLAEARRVVGQFERAVMDAVEQRAALLEEAKNAVLELVVKVSRKVTFDAVSIDPEATVKIINGVINQLVDRSRLTIKVNPDHLPVVEQSLERFLGDSTAIKDLAFEGDARVRTGGCFIETPRGDIDARLESQIDIVAETLLSSGDSL